MNEQKNNSYRIDESGSIIVHNYCAAELPKITVTIHSGQTTYRFGGSYDGTRISSSTTWQKKTKTKQKLF